MSKKTKRAATSSKSIIDLGVERKGRIMAFRGKRQEKRKPIRSIEEAVNILVDAGLDALEAETLSA